MSRDSFVADWSKQGDEEDTSQQGLAALLGLVLARPCFSWPPLRRGSPCPCHPAGVTGLGHRGQWEGQAAVAEQWGAERTLGSGSAATRLPVASRAVAGHPASFPRQLGGHLSCAAAAACLRPGPRHQLRFGPSQ